jgi:DNA-binding transcriptional ArsR family regulator
MDERIGLVKVQIRLVKKDDELINHLIQKLGLTDESKEKIAEILRHNIWTVGQYSDLTGLSKPTITNKMRPLYKNGSLITELDFCFPFADLDGPGPKFIVRNEKSEKLLQ